jgi:ketosteroid isomerase-like protein
MAISSEKAKEVVGNWYAAMGRGDWDNMMGVLDENFTLSLIDKPWGKAVPYLGTWKGREGVAKFNQFRMDNAEVHGFEIKDLIAEGGTVASKLWTKLLSKKTNTEFELNLVHWIKVSDEGKILSCETIFDPVPEINAFAPGSVTY